MEGLGATVVLRGGRAEAGGADFGRCWVNKMIASKKDCRFCIGRVWWCALHVRSLHPSDFFGGGGN